MSWARSLSRALLEIVGRENDVVAGFLDVGDEVNERIVVVLMNGRPLVIEEWAESVPAMVETWHWGSQAGPAIADVLFGDYNPSGRLPVSFPRRVGQLPLYYGYKLSAGGGPSQAKPS